MFAAEPFFTFHQKWDQAVPKVLERLAQAGFMIVCTFDFQDARAGQSSCPCPHHGTEQCDCQMIVLLVYAMEIQPVSLVVHSYDEMTWFYAVNTPQQRVDARLLSLIRQELTPPEPPHTTECSAISKKADPIDSQSIIP